MCAGQPEGYRVHTVRAPRPRPTVHMLRPPDLARGAADAPRDTATAPTSTPGSIPDVEIAASSSTSTTAGTAPPTAPPTTVDESWKQRAAAFCAAYLSE